MKAEYDLAKMKSRRNPYAAKLKKPVTMCLSEDVIAYFKAMAEESGVRYQSLINLYLRDCVAQHRKVEISWRAKRPYGFFRTTDCWRTVLGGLVVECPTSASFVIRWLSPDPV